MALVVKNPLANAADRKDSRVRKILWRRAWQLTPVFLPEESHEQRSVAGSFAWGCKKSDTTEATEHTHTIVTSPD